MAKTRKQLDAMLLHLEGQIPRMLTETDESTFMETFAVGVDAIEHAAGPANIKHVRGRINCMLSSRGLIPGDNEGQPCA